MSLPPPGSGSGSSGPPSFPRPRPMVRDRMAGPSFNKDEHRINERIRVPNVRLIDEKGNQVGVVPTAEALKMARERGLDLMEVASTASPPVCKICDYGKFKYEKKKKEHEAKKKQVVVKVKEIQLRPNTDQHDFDYKVRNVREFLEEGDKAKITIMFRGREVAHADGSFQTMRDIVEKCYDVGMVEAPAKMEGKKLIMILAPLPPSEKKKRLAELAAKPGVTPASTAPTKITTNSG